MNIWGYYLFCHFCAAALDQIEGSHAAGHKTDETAVAHKRIDLRSHGQDTFQRHTVQPGKGRQQIDGVKGGAEQRQDQSPHYAARQSALFTLFKVVDDGGGQDKTAADDEVGQIPHKGGAPLSGTIPLYHGHW